MSTIATTNIKEPSSATNNITLTSGGDTTISGNATVTGTPTFGGLTYPTADGTANQVLKTDGSGTLSFASPFTYGTEQALTGVNSSHTFTGIPSTAKRITILVVDASASGTGQPQLAMQAGPSSGVITTNIYKYSVSYANSQEASAGASYYRLLHSNYSDPSEVWNGRITLNKLTASSNTWVVDSLIGTTGGFVNQSAGSFALGSDVLDRIQLLHGSAINYDAGTVNIMYES